MGILLDLKYQSRLWAWSLAVVMATSVATGFLVPVEVLSTVSAERTSKKKSQSKHVKKKSSSKNALRHSVAVLPAEGNLEDWPEYEVELAYHSVKLFQKAGFLVLSPRQVTTNLKNSGVSECEDSDWMKCATLIRQALNVDEVILFQLNVRRGKPDRLTLLVVGEEGLKDPVTLRAYKNESLEDFIARLIAKAYPTAEIATQSEDSKSAASTADTIALDENERAEIQENAVDASLKSEMEDKGLTERRTEYPIVGPAILGAAGAALTSLAIVSFVTPSCSERDAQGNCVRGSTRKDAELLGYGMSGAAALSGAVFWFFFGAEQVPVQVDAAATDSAAQILIKGKF